MFSQRIRMQHISLPYLSKSSQLLWAYHFQASQRHPWKLLPQSYPQELFFEFGVIGLCKDIYALTILFQLGLDFFINLINDLGIRILYSFFLLFQGSIVLCGFTLKLFLLKNGSQGHGMEAGFLLSSSHLEEGCRDDLLGSPHQSSISGSFLESHPYLLSSSLFLCFIPLQTSKKSIASHFICLQSHYLPRFSCAILFFRTSCCLLKFFTSAYFWLYFMEASCPLSVASFSFPSSQVSLLVRNFN